MKFQEFDSPPSKPLIMILVACSLLAFLGSAQAQTICNQQPAVSVNNGSYHVQNNEFASTAQECINVNGTIFNVTQSGISNPTNNAPGAYPSIYIGCHWGSCTSNSGLPVQVSAVNNARSDWNTSQPTSGTYDTAYDIWFNTTPTTTGQPDGAEIMIWLNFRGAIQPFGNLVATGVTVGGAAYDVWFGRQSSGPGWNVISYVAHNITISASNLDIKAFTTDAVSRNYITNSWYLIAVEAGFEIWQGGAGLATNSFSAAINNTLGTAPLNVWWPTDGSVLSGTQLFKSRLENIALGSYQMFWSVDGGQFNAMGNNTDHKEYSVDLSGWTWRDAGNYWGPFLVTFTAEDLSGTIVQQKTITLYVAKQ